MSAPSQQAPMRECEQWHRNVATLRHRSGEAAAAAIECGAPAVTAQLPPRAKSERSSASRRLWPAIYLVWGAHPLPWLVLMPHGRTIDIANFLVSLRGRSSAEVPES